MSRKKLEPRVCRWCDELFEPKHYRQHYCCPEHSCLMMMEVARQMQAREGEYYDNWLKGMDLAMHKALSRGAT